MARLADALTAAYQAGRTEPAERGLLLDDLSDVQRLREPLDAD